MTTEAKLRFTLPPGLMAALGSFSGTPLNRLSPLSAAPPEAGARRQLTELHVLDANGRVATSFEPLLRTLAAPSGVAHVRLTGGSSIVDFQVYSGAEGTVSAVSVEAGLEVTSPAETGEATRTLTEHLGFSVLSSLTIPLQLSAADSLVFAAVIDYHRRRRLEALVSSAQFLGGSIDTAAVRGMLQRPSGNPQWIVPILSMMTGIEPTAAAESVDETVGRFSADVSQAAEQIAGRFSVIDKVLAMTSAGLGSDGEPVVSRMGCVQAGVHDLLVIEPGPDGVGFVTLPSAVIVSRIAAILEDPARELASASFAGVPSRSRRFCAACGASFVEGARFCTGCGSARPE